MDLSLELLSSCLAEYIQEQLEMKNFDANKLVDAKATRILQEIQEVLASDDLSDFDAVEKIVCIFEKHKLSTGGRHDF